MTDETPRRSPEDPDGRARRRAPDEGGTQDRPQGPRGSANGPADADAQPGASTAEAIDRATAAVGHDDGKR